MKLLSQNHKLFFAVTSILAIGFMTTKAHSVALILAALLLTLGSYMIVKTRNQYGLAHLLAGYVIAAEVYFRMASVGLPWEFGKLSAIIFLTLGLMVDQRKRETPLMLIAYGLLLVPALWLTADYFDDIVKLKSQFLFNLSGSLLLVISSMYFYKRPFTKQEFIHFSQWMIFGVLTMSVLVYANVGDYTALSFNGGSNAQASGGFSGNQVSLVFGIGVLVIGLNLVLKHTLFFRVWFDVVLLITFVFQGLMTFSRGGVLGAVIAIALGALVYYFANIQMFIEFMVKHSIKLVLAVILSIATFSYVDEMTGGMLYKRYFNVDEQGYKIKKTYGTGRGEIMEGDIMLLEDSLYVGVGVGVSRYERPLHNDYASHVEYSRLLAEHGILGIFALIILLLYPFKHYFQQMGRPENQMIAVTFIVFALFSMTHSATRIAAITFFYGAGYLILNLKEKTDEE